VQHLGWRLFVYLSVIIKVVKKIITWLHGYSVSGRVTFGARIPVQVPLGVEEGASGVQAGHHV